MDETPISKTIAIEAGDALRLCECFEIRKHALHQHEPALRCGDEIEARGNGGRIAVDGEDARAWNGEDGPAIAAGAEGGIEENFAGLRGERGKNFVTKHGKVAGRSAGGENVSFAAARCHSRAPCDRGPSGAA